MGKDIQAAPHAATHEPTARLPLHNEFKSLRLARRESQEKFWSRFGVTQSSGSRFETGTGIPPAVAILLRLYLKGKLSDKDLLA
ncbi:MAG: helix-turn-helix transcriptional regulator [Pseudomonadota bacterium]